MELVWTESAVADLQALRQWLGRDYLPLAERTTDAIFAALDRVLPLPRLGRTVAELEDESVRELVFRTFRVVYEVGDGRVAVLAVLQGGRLAERREPRRWEIT